MAFPGLSNKLQRPAVDSSHQLLLTLPRLPPAPLKTLPRFPAASSASLQRPMAFPAYASLQRPVAFSAGPFQPPAFSYGAEVLERPVAFPMTLDLALTCTRVCRRVTSEASPKLFTPICGRSDALPLPSLKKGVGGTRALAHSIKQFNSAVTERYYSLMCYHPGHLLVELSIKLSHLHPCISPISWRADAGFGAYILSLAEAHVKSLQYEAKKYQKSRNIMIITSVGT